MGWFNVAVQVSASGVFAPSDAEAQASVRRRLESAGFEVYDGDPDMEHHSAPTIRSGEFDVIVPVVEVVPALDAASAVNTLMDRLRSSGFTPSPNLPSNSFPSECDPDGNPV